MQNSSRFQEASTRFEGIVQSDPIKISKYTKSETSAKQMKLIYTLLVVIPLLLVISFVFYMVASMDGAMFGTPEDEIDTIISQKMKSIITQADEESGGMASGHVGDAFEKVQFGLKLVPNMDQASFLLKMMQMVGGSETGYTGLESYIEYDEEGLGDYGNYPHFFEWNGAQHLAFPNFSFDLDHIPLGDSVNMCLGLSWTTLKKKSQYDKYLDVRGFEDCQQAVSGRSQWESDYPDKGLNFKLWDQHMARGDTVCSNGIYVESTDICFTYHVLTQVCMLVKFEKDVSTNTYSWIYTGGCFKDNKPVIYDQADPYKKDDFKDIQFEVRLDHRSFQDINDAMNQEQQDDGQEAFDDEEEYDASTNSTSEKPQDKIRREKQELLSQAANGEVKPTGFYFFYRIFVFLGGLSFFLAIVSIGILIYTMVQIIQKNRNEEGQGLINQNQMNSDNNMYNGDGYEFDDDGQPLR